MVENQYIIFACETLVKMGYARSLASIAKECGKTSQYFTDLKNGKAQYSREFLDILIEKYPVNKNYVLSGVGTPLIDRLKPQHYYGGEGFEQPAYVPLLPISAQGGSLNDFFVSVKDTECERVVSPIKGADFAMTVAGDSMAPEYPSGSQILIKKINEKAFIDWGKVYVLDTCNGSVIKRIFPSEDKNTRKVKCVSVNPDYPSFEVSLDDVYGVYRVLLCMSVK